MVDYESNFNYHHLEFFNVMFKINCIRPARKATNYMQIYHSSIPGSWYSERSVFSVPLNFTFKYFNLQSFQYLSPKQYSGKNNIQF